MLNELDEGASFEAFDSAVRSIVELFDALSRPGRYHAQGLWAELGLIAYGAAPSRAARAWHQHTGDLFDFADADFRVEVKSTTRQRRIHSVSLGQLSAAEAGETLLVSLVLRPDDDGHSIDDLMERARDVLRPEPPLQRRLEEVLADGLGADWRSAATVRFDLDAALSSVRFYRAADVPCVDRNVPDEVSNVRFSVDLSEVPSLSPEEVGAVSPLTAALVPAPR